MAAASDSLDPVANIEDPIEDLRMLEERGSKYAQTDALDCILFINDKIVGEPHRDALSKLTIPPRDACNCLVFHADYLTPEYNYSYITISVSAMIKRRSKQSQQAHLVKLAKIELPMVKCPSAQPMIDVLDKASAAKLLGVEKCSDMIAKYTLTGAPRFFREDRKTSIPNKKVEELLTILEADLLATPEVKISLVHSMCDMRDDGDDPKLDQTYKILAECTDGWSRDKKNPLAVYFVNSPSKEMLDIGTVPKGDKIPFVDQLPPRSIFENKKQYMVAMAIGTQQEKEYHDRLHGKLSGTEVPVRFIADPASMHPTSGTAQEYFMLVDTTLMPDESYLLPKVGDSAKVMLPGIITKRQDVPEDKTEEVNYKIGDYIKECYDRCLKRHSGPEILDKLFDELQFLCVRDDKDEPIPDNSKTLRNQIEETSEIAPNQEELIKFIGANRKWLRAPPATIDEDVNPFTNPAVLHAHRLDAASTLWPASTQVWKARVPIDKATGSARLPLILDMRDASRDDKRNILDRKGFAELAKSGKAIQNVKITVVDSDKTYKAEMNAFKKLLAPHTQPLDDRPSMASLQLFNDLLSKEKFDGKELSHKYKYLSKDKRQVIRDLLEDKKMIKYIHGPPGTGKSYLLLFLTCVALTCSPPAGPDDERNLPVDVGKQLNAVEYDKVDQSAALRSIQLTDEQKNKPEFAESTRVKVLITSGQNTAVDDLVPRLRAMWNDGFEDLRPEPVILRMYSLEVESMDFPRRLANLRRQIERKTENVTDNILLCLLLRFSQNVDEYEREGHRNRRPNPSVVDKAIELYHADSEAPQADRKYSTLRGLIKKVSENPDDYLTMRKEISTLVKQGPQMDAIMLADVIICTPVAASDRTFRTTFRPHFIFCDEVARDREMTFNILVAHYSPVAFITAGDHKQLSPIVFSIYQHVKYKLKCGFKPEEEPLSNPSTFAPQLKKSAVHRLVEAGFKTHQLTFNRRAHSSVGLFFSEQFYNKSVTFQGVAASDRVDKSVINWLGQLKGGKTQGNSLMIDMHSIEREDARSFSNIAHVNYALQAAVDLLADVNFAPTGKNPNAGKILIVATYEAQRNLYSTQLKQRGDYEHTSDGTFIKFDKSRIEVRSHEGAQGHEASVVIVDLVRSSAPGFTGHSDLLAICSSRAICGQLVLINKSIIRPTDNKNAPNLRHLVAWMSHHEDYGMLHSLDSQTANYLRIV